MPRDNLSVHITERTSPSGQAGDPLLQGHQYQPCGSEGKARKKDLLGVGWTSGLVFKSLAGNTISSLVPWRKESNLQNWAAA